MLVESCAIMVLVTVIAFVCMRQGKKDYGLSFLPLLLVPFFNVAGFGIAKPFFHYFNIHLAQTRVFINVLALVLACILFGLNSKVYKSKRVRRGYLFICGGFTGILFWIFIADILSKLY